MNNIKNQIGVGTANISENAKKYVNDVLDSGRLSYGKYLKGFEKKFAECHSMKYGVMMNSGTSALRLAIACLKEVHNWPEGSEIILPAVTFISDYNVVVDQGFKPVFVDVEVDSYNIDPKKIIEKITPNTKAIMVVHLFGQPADMDPIMDICEKNNLKLIEDSCETMFVSYKGRKVGSFGDISCFSTYMAHLLTSGVGGLALTNSEEYAVILRSLMNHGRDSVYLSIDDDKGLSKEELTSVVSRRFSFVRPGYSFRVTEMEGALALAQFEERDTILSGRAACAQYYISELSQFGHVIQLPHIQPNREHAYMMFPIVIKEGVINRKDLVMFLEQHNIETRDMLPFINQPVVVKQFGDIEHDYPVARWINSHGFYIGCHEKITQNERKYIISVFKEFFNNVNQNL
jgi:perosamine synthetase